MAYSAFVSLIVASLMSLSWARAVNISNTWMLPEEGFPVFYRYFRDRISWYEADAVCQFHHANLVTADSSSQYDAIRAYLKELDITENVWIGLSKVSDKPNFTWTDFRPLTGEGHWQEAIPTTTDPMCVTMDPAADFLWRAMQCGGPEVASFICELPIPSWASGPRGCLLTELPSLTVLYIPEQSAVELTSDCGLDGTKRIACKGDANREEILRQLTCAISSDDDDDADKPTKASVTSSSATYDTSDESSPSGRTTKTWIWTSNTVDIDYGMPTRHRRETEDTLSPVSTRSTSGLGVDRAGATVATYTTPAMGNRVSTTPAMSYKKNVTTSVSEEYPTLAASVSKAVDKSPGITGSVREFTTQSPGQDDRDKEATTDSHFTAYPKSPVTDVEETSAEYPSAIGQGQLFSIIENGTMFDIIELNDSNAETTPKPQQTTTALQIKNDSKDNTTEIPPPTPDNPRDKSFNNKAVMKPEKTTKKDTYKEFEHKKIVSKVAPTKESIKLEGKHTKDTITKEVEMYPVIKDPSIRLNRTFRKELPRNPYDKGDINEGNKSKLINLSINNDLSDPENEHIEIKLQKERKGNITETLLITGSKRMLPEDKIEQNSSSLPNSTDIVLNVTNNTKNASDTNGEEVQEMKKQFLPKSLLSDTTTKRTEYGTSSPLEGEMESPPRPNRQRQLTRPQRRSFYPNFFSRVLG